jgi:hypothetical protein
MMASNKVKLDLFSNILGFLVIAIALIGFCYSFVGEGLFYNELTPVMSPFTYFSLLLMMTSKMAERHIETWSKLFTLALLGVVACGNFSSLWIQLTIPDLFFKSIPGVVPTSAMTSIGLIIFCFYDILVSIRKTPKSAFIIDDILLHLALFPGGLSLLGHILGVKAYMGAGIDPRMGIAPTEMFLMGSYALVAVATNPNLFLWDFLSKSLFNKLTFGLLFLNQYVAPIAVGLSFRDPEMSTYSFGIEFYVMLSGVLATLIFLVVNAFYLRDR